MALNILGFFFLVSVEKNVEILPLPNNARWWFQAFFMFIPIWGRFPFWLIFFKWLKPTRLPNNGFIQLDRRFFHDFCWDFWGPKHLGRKQCCRWKWGGTADVGQRVVGGWFAFSTEKSINDLAAMRTKKHPVSVRKVCGKNCFLVESWNSGCLTRAGKHFWGTKHFHWWFFFSKSQFRNRLVLGSLRLWFFYPRARGPWFRVKRSLKTATVVVQQEMVTNVVKGIWIWHKLTYKNIPFEVGKDLFFVYGFYVWGYGFPIY